MIDCHAHYYPPAFQPCNDDVPQYLIVIAVSETMLEAQTILDLSREFPFIKACAGLHPEYVSSLDPETITNKLSEFDGWIKRNKSDLVGIGECGLDYSFKAIPKEMIPKDQIIKRESQQLVFRKHIEYGKEYDLPLNVHSRNAGHYVIKELYESQSRAVLHAFDGRINYALEGVSKGLFFSIPPCIVRSQHFQKLAKNVPLTHLLLESDAPALGPIIDQSNHPRNVQISAKEIARIKEISLDLVLEMTTENAKNLFSL